MKAAGFYLTIITSIFFFQNISKAQVFGTVSDEQSKPLPFANVYIEGTTTGTTTNENGEYFINPGEGNFTLVFQYVGYKQIKRNISLSHQQALRLDISLPPEIISLSEIEIKANAEDPAYPIIRKAIAKRNEYLNQVPAYACDVYVKGNIKLLEAPERFLGEEVGDLGGMLDSSRQGMLYLSESVSKYYFQAPNNTKEVMISSKVAGNDNGFSFNSATDMEVNFYQNLVEIGRKIVSPIADAAFNYYKYQLEGSFFDKDNKLIYKIRVVPKNASGPVVEGFLYIADESWNIYSTDLYTTGNNILMPLIDTLYIRQTYVLAQKPNIWRIFSQTYEFTGNILGFRIGGTFTGIFQKYDLNPNFPKNFFDNTIMTVEPEANKKDSTYWQSSRPIPLTEEEQKNYHRQDSLAVVKKSDAYLDSVDKAANRFELIDLLSSYSFQNSKKNSSGKILLPIGNTDFNLIQGLTLFTGIEFKKSFGDPYKRRCAALLNINYGLTEKKIRGNAEISFDYNRKFNGTIQLAGGEKLTQYNEDEPISKNVSSFYNFLFRRNYIRYYNEKFFQIGWRHEIWNEVLVHLGTKYTHRSPLENLSDFSIFYRDSREFDPNIPGNLQNFDKRLLQNNALIMDVTLRWRPGQQIIDYPYTRIRLGTEWPEMSVGLRKGIVVKGLQNDFLKIYASILKEDIAWGVAGRSSFLAEAGKIITEGDGILYFADYHHFLGNQTNIVDKNRFLTSFRALPYYDYSINDSWVRVHFEHNFDGFIMDKLPLFKKLKVSMVVGAAYLKTPDVDSYWEVGAGIDRLGIGVARVFRFDLTAAFLNGTYQGLTWTLGFKFLIPSQDNQM